MSPAPIPSRLAQEWHDATAAATNARADAAGLGLCALLGVPLLAAPKVDFVSIIAVWDGGEVLNSWTHSVTSTAYGEMHLPPSLVHPGVDFWSALDQAQFEGLHGGRSPVTKLLDDAGVANDLLASSSRVHRLHVSTRRTDGENAVLTLASGDDPSREPVTFGFTTRALD